MREKEEFNNDYDEFNIDKVLLEVGIPMVETNNIQSQSSCKFAFEDWERSGINKETIENYIKQGYLTEDEHGWTLGYPALTANFKSDYWCTRLKKPKYGQGKYLKPAGIPSRIFRPLALSVPIVTDRNKYLIITEGTKKATKAVQEGFPCVSIDGVYCWKKNPDNNDDENKDTEGDILSADIIPDLVNVDFVNKIIYLCYDSDMWHNPKVKQALYQFAAYLISEKGAIVKIILLPDGEAKGLDDFLMAKGAEEFQKLLDNAKNVTLKDIQAELADKKSLTKFPLEIFPENISYLIKDMNRQYDAPIEYIACVFLAVVSILICGHYSINVKPSSDWIEHPILWLALIGNPSQKKTPCLKIGKDILDGYDSTLEIEYEDKLKEYHIKKAEYEASIKERKEKIKKKEPVGGYLQEPEKPLKARFTVQNVTVESLFDVIKANSSYLLGVAIYIDELAFLFNSFDQYKKGGNDKQYFLQSWSKAKQNIVRKSSKTDYKVDVGHNIIGGIQPKVLYKSLFKNGIEAYDGMVERWLFVCSDYLEQGFTNNDDNSDDDYLNPENKNKFEKLCDDICLHILNYKDIQTEFTLDDEAQKVFIDFCNQIVRKKKSDKLNDLTKSYLQKQTSYIARFALVLQCFYDFKNKIISKDIVQKAIKLSRYFISCFLNILNEKIESNPLEDTALSYIKAKNLKSISPTQLFKSNENRYKTTEKAKHVLENLARKGFGRLIKAKNGTKFVFYGS